MIAAFRKFSMADKDGNSTGWLKYERQGHLYEDVAKFLTLLGKDAIISVNTIHSEGVFTHVIVWFWEQDE